MSPELEEKLVQDFPSLFISDGRRLCFGCECGDGWYEIVRAFCWIAKDSDLRFSQIKEKFGGLRLYYYGGNDRIHGACRMAESISYITCETCGLPGKPNKGGWIKTLCETCRGCN